MRRQSNREGGQALVELALIVFPLLILVGGIIQLGVAVSNWNALNIVASQSARAAAVNAWPGCSESFTTCTTNPACNAASLDRRSLVNYIGCELEANGMSASSVTIEVCQPLGNEVGQPVTVRLSTRKNFLSVLETAVDPSVVDWLGVTIRGEVTLSLAMPPTKYAAAVC